MINEWDNIYAANYSLFYGLTTYPYTQPNSLESSPLVVGVYTDTTSADKKDFFLTFDE